jgi:hypothetical protein
MLNVIHKLGDKLECVMVCGNILKTRRRRPKHALTRSPRSFISINGEARVFQTAVVSPIHGRPQA